jgi:hypothetical protein
VSSATTIPVIACGGVGRFEDYAEGIRAGASAAAAANLWHFKELSDRAGKRADGEGRHSGAPLMAVQYCTRCVYPAVAATPLTFDERGVCSGCRVAEQKGHIDWDRRGQC